jgi:5-methylcytosine-specific restriction endonuclease McrBC regulatory subunit McrC
MLLLSFDGIDCSPNVYRDFKASVEDRSMNRYFSAMKWCRLFLLNKGTTSFFCGGKVSYAMLFPIDKLFCGCIAKSLRKQINREKYYFLTPEKNTNSLANVALDLNMEPLSNFYVKSKEDDSAINIVFKFYDFSDYHGFDDGSTAVVFPVTEVLNRQLDGIKRNMYLIDLKDIDGSVSVLNETFFR